MPYSPAGPPPSIEPKMYAGINPCGWVSSDLLFGIKDGHTTPVMRLSTQKRDAVYLDAEDAATYLAFLRKRAPEVKFELVAAEDVKDHFVIEWSQQASA
jgi:hypothetical protein